MEITMPALGKLTLALTIIASIASIGSVANAQTAIDKPARIIVGFPPGGAADSIARLLASQLTGSYAPTVIVENKAGAGGRIGVQTVKASDADG
jgi:tripartite-type tricarboxylate transporter receptor subunit TctC